MIYVSWLILDKIRNEYLLFTSGEGYKIMENMPHEN